VRFEIVFRTVSFYCKDVKVTVAKQEKSEDQLLDHATGNLLRAVKQEMLKKHGRVDYGKLRKDGYSNRILTKLKEA